MVIDASVSEKPRMHDWLIVPLLATMSGLTALSIDIFLPSLPDMATEFGVPIGEVSLTISAFLLSFAAAQLVFGPLSDRFGRVPTLSAGLVLYLGATLLCTYAHSLNLLIVARFLQGFAACSGPVTAFAVVRDVYEKERAARIYAYISMVTALAPAIAPTLGSFLAEWRGWRVCFSFLAVLTCVVFVLVRTFLLETNHRRVSLHPRIIFSIYGQMLFHGQFMRFAVASGCAFAALMAFISTSSYVFITLLKFSMTDYAKVFAANALTLLAGSFVTGIISARYGMVRMVRLGSFLILLGSFLMGALALAFPPAAFNVLLPMMICTFGISMVFPNGVAGALQPFKETAGSASALVGFIRFGAGALMAGLMGFVVGTTAFSVAVSMFLCGLAMQICLRKL